MLLINSVSEVDDYFAQSLGHVALSFRSSFSNWIVEGGLY